MAGPIALEDDTEVVYVEEDSVFRRFWIKVLAAVVITAVCGWSLLGLVSVAKVDELAPLSRVATLPHDRKLDPDHVEQRIILVGDVHGMSKELHKLLKKAHYRKHKDTLVFLGDMITKGYDSMGVVDFAIKNNAYCVRGNHEDEVLSIYAEQHHLTMPQTYPPYASATTMTAFDAPEATLAATLGPDLRAKAEPKATALAKAEPKDAKVEHVKRAEAEPKAKAQRNQELFELASENQMASDELEWSDFYDQAEFDDEAEFDEADYTSLEYTSLEYTAQDEERDGPLAKKLKQRHIDYISACPAILQLGKVSKRGIEAVAVHGGLLWHEHELEQQRIEDVLRIRSIVPPDYEHGSEDPDDGEPWFDRWNREQRTRPKSERFEVFYGHDASKGLQLRRYSKGLDTKCQRGGELSAYVVEVHHNGRYSEKLVSIDC